ncbi:DUF4062 domain-containing protein [Cohnella sp. GCM10020058]|uniref:DUF4062 domain-containing protein n=1 Tax=Cohnella sp. GCM10020058 TaxID=3317330 RepID=UPI00362C18AC
MNKKLQVFISSTFIDLQEERQAAVEAVLRAGHIPAGMELFTPADQSQKDTIERWIRESDVYLLILGGRYGAIEPVSKKSYTHWEYDLAGTLGIPRFSVVIKDRALDEKIKSMGAAALERENTQAYNDFKSTVLSRISHFFDDTKDIKLTILQALGDFKNDDNLSGWISGKEIENVNQLTKLVAELMDENKKLKSKLQSITQSNNAKEAQKTEKSYDDGDVPFEDRIDRILDTLEASRVNTKGYISWGVNEEDNEEGVKEESEEIRPKSIRIPPPPREFNPYFIFEEDGETYKELIILSILEDIEEVKPRLADIRVLLSDYKIIEAVPIKFVICLEGEHTELKERANLFLQKGLSIVSAIDPELFSIEIWDTNAVENFEDDLGLKF